MTDRITRTACLLALLLAPAALNAAGGPYVVDDAEPLGAGECLAEAWHTRHRAGGDASVAGLGCHLGGAEWSLYGVRGRSGDARDDAVAVQAKWQLRAVEGGVPGIALVFGGGADTRVGHLAELYALLPMTWTPAESLRLNLNLGLVRDRSAAQWSTTWGAGMDWQLLPRLHLIGERFGDDRGEGGWQLGLRPVLRVDALHLDLAWGRDLDGIPGSAWSLGLAWAF